ncbi:MAG: DNA-3-methyladenine glycosylase I [Nanoarchaeota archaeon]|nr:DNA-3-methyladenine glycosylase I [Nanoarchaeota archaeon]
MVTRCTWANPKNELYLDYHDHEWGRPIHDDRLLFEFLILEGAQAGLSWETVLNKRAEYKRVFDNFDAKKVSKYGEKKIQELLLNPGIIRNQLKIRSAVQNARVFLEIQSEFGSFDAYVWKFVDGKTLVNHFKTLGEIPTRTEVSDALSKDLKKRGMNFVGSTIMYAFMQAVGMVDDHTADCFVRKK